MEIHIIAMSEKAFDELTSEERTFQVVKGRGTIHVGDLILARETKEREIDDGDVSPVAETEDVLTGEEMFFEVMHIGNLANGEWSVLGVQPREPKTYA